MAPSTAARTAFAGTRLTIHCAGVWIAAAPEVTVLDVEATAARTLAAAAGSILSREKTGGAVTAPTSPEAMSSTTNRTIPRPPTLPTTAPLPDDATPTIRLDTTSGMTVTRMAFTNNVPIGSKTATAADAAPASRYRRPRPAAVPAIRARRTRVERDTRRTYSAASSVRD